MDSQLHRYPRKETPPNPAVLVHKPPTEAAGSGKDREGGDRPRDVRGEFRTHLNGLPPPASVPRHRLTSIHGPLSQPMSLSPQRLPPTPSPGSRGTGDLSEVNPRPLMYARLIRKHRNQLGDEQRRRRRNYDPTSCILALQPPSSGLGADQRLQIRVSACLL